MSRFLGPIHYWLFNKIKLHENLEEEIVEKFKNQYEDEVEALVKGNREKYGELLPDKTLDEMIDTDNIHGWLQERIGIAETRQAAILGEFVSHFKEDAIQLATLVYEHHGIRCGEEARNKVTLNTAEELYKLLNNYILDGMPCDQGNRITKNEENDLEYTTVECLHIGYWKKTGVSPDVMYALRRTWIQAFINSANPAFKYQVDAEAIGEGKGFVHKIFKK